MVLLNGAEGTNVTFRAEIYEDRLVARKVADNVFDLSEEVFLGSYELAHLPRTDEWLSLRCLDTFSSRGSNCFNVYRVTEIWHEAINTSWPSFAEQFSDEIRAPVTKIYVSFCYYLEPGVVKGHRHPRAAVPGRLERQRSGTGS